MSFHTMAAAFVSPALALDSTSKDFDGKSEAGFLAQSIVDVARHYNVGVLDQKTVDWLNLLQALGLVYGTRLFAMRAMRPARKAAPAAPPFPAPPPAQHHPQAQATSDGIPPFGRDITQERPAPASETEVRTGEIPGVGKVEFPADHPLATGRKLN